MSYGFTMNFVSARSYGDALKKANLATESLWRNIRQFIEDNEFYIPSLRYQREEFSPEIVKRRIDEGWLAQVAQMTFVYWPQFKILGLLGDGYPDDVRRIFKTRVYFQNSCDQDYDFADWKGLSGEPFKSVLEVCKNGSTEEVIKLLNEGREDYPWEVEESDMEPDRFMYFRRSAAYNAIFNRLSLNSILYGVDDETFLRFRMTPLCSAERTFEADRLLHAFSKEHESK